MLFFICCEILVLMLLVMVLVMIFMILVLPNMSLIPWQNILHEDHLAFLISVVKGKDVFVFILISCLFSCIKSKSSGKKNSDHNF
jgi:hypothetical protein